MSGPKFRGRLLNGFASFTSADQVQPVRVRRYQKRKIQVSFNGTMEKGDQIAQVVWDTDGPWVVRMSDPGVSADKRTATLMAEFNYPGLCSVRCQVTTESGDTANYEYRVRVTNAPIMPLDSYAPATGPFRLVYDV